MGRLPESRGPVDLLIPMDNATIVIFCCEKQFGGGVSCEDMSFACKVKMLCGGWIVRCWH